MSVHDVVHDQLSCQLGPICSVFCIHTINHLHCFKKCVAHWLLLMVVSAHMWLIPGNFPGPIYSGLGQYLRNLYMYLHNKSFRLFRKSLLLTGYH